MGRLSPKRINPISAKNQKIKGLGVAPNEPPSSTIHAEDSI